MKISTFFTAVLLITTRFSALAQDPTQPTSVIRESSPGVYELGAIRIDKEKNTITFPGRVNMDKGVLEYLLVGPLGSTHESLLVTEVPVTDVHTAMLLLGAKGAGIHAPAPQDQPTGQITNEYLKNAPEIKGDRIFINVKWKQDDAEKENPVEDWIVRTKTNKPAERGAWIYNGSMFGADGKFLAAGEQAFAALLPYPPALMNNPRKYEADDSLWDVNEKAVPPVDTPVQISIRLEPQAVKPQ